MRKYFYLLFFLFIYLQSCKHYRLDKKEYYSLKSYPKEFSKCTLKFSSDSTGILQNKLDNSFYDFSFKVYKKKFLIVSSVQSNSDANSVLFVQDTLVVFKKRIYYFNEKMKLIFERR